MTHTPSTTRPVEDYEDDTFQTSIKRAKPRPMPGMFTSYRELALFVGWWAFLVLFFFAAFAAALDLMRYFWTLV